MRDPSVPLKFFAKTAVGPGVNRKVGRIAGVRVLRIPPGADLLDKGLESAGCRQGVHVHRVLDSESAGAGVHYLGFEVQ